MTGRKYIRIALTPKDEIELKKAKAKSENLTGIVMSDSMYALSVIRKNIAAENVIDEIISGDQE